MIKANGPKNIKAREMPRKREAKEARDTWDESKVVQRCLITEECDEDEEEAT